MTQRMPVAGSYNTSFIAEFEMACEAVASVRALRQQKNISPRETLTLRIHGDFPAEVQPVIVKLGNVRIETAADAQNGQQGVSEAGSISFMVRTVKMSVPLTGLVDVAEEVAKLEADLKYLEGFLSSVRKKLSNEKFVSGAPAAVVANERKKEADALAKIATVQASLNNLK